MFINALLIIVRQNFRKFSVEMVNKCFYFECTVRSIILSVTSEMKVLGNLDKMI